MQIHLIAASDRIIVTTHPSEICIAMLQPKSATENIIDCSAYNINRVVTIWQISPDSPHVYYSSKYILMRGTLIQAEYVPKKTRPLHK
jgi:hypothetical protein